MRAAAWLGVSLLALCAGPSVADGPKGGRVVHGQARIEAAPGRTTIRQTTRRAVIDWRSFDVDRGDDVTFDQPGRNAATLNRVLGAGPSAIAGSIHAPGTVVIQNEAGVLFTGSSRVEAGGLVATSQAADAVRFQRDGVLDLAGGGRGARVVNQGQLTVEGAGLAALVGGDVVNAGSIVAERGTVALAGGSRTTLDLTGDGMLRIAVEGATGSVANRGRLEADGGLVVLSAGEAARSLESAVNTSGVIRARSGVDRGGRIELIGRGNAGVRITGKLDAAGERRGGDVVVTGRSVTVGGDARISANGASGGNIRIGGDRQGEGSLRRARSLAVGTGARITADGATGPGGTVIAWSDGATWIDGRISATGGDGGFVETSGLGSLGLGSAASVDVGAGGAWLLDPRDVTIGDVVPAPAIGPGVIAPPPGSGAWTVSRVALQSALDAGSDVTVTTTQGGSHGNGDITVAKAFGWAGEGSLRLEAERDIAINAGVTTGGGFTAVAGRDLDIRADVTGTGAAPVSLVAGSGDLRLSRATGADLGVTTESGALTLTASQGDVTLKRLGGSGGGILVGSDSGALNISAGGMILVQGGAKDGQWVRVGSITSASDVTLAAPRIDVLGGTGAGSIGEVVAGAGGALSLTADRLDVRSWPNRSEAQVAAFDGAPLTLEAARQRWDGTVRSGTGLADGGDVRISGAITATVRPTFALAPDANFAFAATAPSGTASSYLSAHPLMISTTGTGSIGIDAPVFAERATLISQEMVRLGAGARIQVTAPQDALVIAAGRAFVNDAGTDALSAPRLDARWLIYLDRFDGVSGPLPGPREFDLYGRTFQSTPPALVGPRGNRVIYGERPTLTLSAAPARKTYGTSVALGYTASGLRPDDSLATALASGPVVVSAGVPVDAPAGSYPARVAATPSAQGYRLVVEGSRLTVDPAPLTVTALDATRLYGGADPAFAVRYDGLTAGDGSAALGGALSFSTAAGPSSPVGDYAVIPAGLVSGNYAISYLPGTLSVTPAALSIVAEDAARSYGSTNPAFGARYDGLVAGDRPGDLDGTLGFVTAATRSTAVGSYDVMPRGVASGNYAISYRPGTLSVTPAALSIVAEDATRSYGSTNPTFGARYEGLVAGDRPGDLDGTLGFVTAATRSTGVGSYDVMPRGVTSGNYAISFAPGRLSVTPAPLTVTAEATSRTYGADNPDFTARFTGFAPGEGIDDLHGRLGLTTTAANTSPVGTYAVMPGGLSGSNYAITFRPGTLAVQPAPLTVSALDAARGTGAANPPFQVRYSGFVLAESERDLGGRLAFATDAAPESAPGRYRVMPDGLIGGNYAIRYRGGWLSVAAAAPPQVAAPQRQGDLVTFRRGVPPLTPGDASFRTTVAESPPALGNPFALSYSLGEVIELTASGEPPAPGPSPAGAGTQGFVPAAGGVGSGDTQGFVAAAGGSAAGGGSAASGGGGGAGAAATGCAGSLGLGVTACARRSVRESYWTTVASGTP